MRIWILQPAAHLIRVFGSVFLLLLAQVLAAPAQSDNPGQQSANLPKIELSDGQRQTIYMSVTNQNTKNEAPPDFQPVVGAAVPAMVELEDMPKTIVQLIPATADYKMARIVNQVVIVDPQTRRVVEVISGKGL